MSQIDHEFYDGSGHVSADAIISEASPVEPGLFAMLEWRPSGHLHLLRANVRCGALCVVLALAFARAMWPSGPEDQAPKPPELPRLSVDTYPLTLRSELQTAYTAAISNPGNASANGKLGMVLHAYGRAGEAEVCYQRAHLLDPESFRWA